MPDRISESLPHLADALVEVGTRLGEIGAELRALAPAADQPPPHPEASQARAFPAHPVGPEATAAQAGHETAGTGEPAVAVDRPATPGQPDTDPTTVPETGTPLPGQSGTESAAAPEPAAATQTGQPPAGQPTDAGHLTDAMAAWIAGQSGPIPADPAAQPAGGHQPAGAASWPHQLPQPPQQQAPVWFGSLTPPAEPPPTLWERLSRDGAGSRILAWVGGVVTLAGVVLLLILAIQRGYLGPLPRVLLGAGLGLTLAGIGALLHRSPTARTGAYALAATGIAVLYLDVVAATSLYHFLPPWGGLAAGLAVTAAGVALAGRWDSQLLAVFVVVCCAASAPVITGGFGALLLSFLLVLLLGTTPVQLLKRWSGLAVAAGLPPVIVCFVNVVLAMTHQLDEDATTTAILAGATAGTVIILATATAIRRPDDEFTLITLFLAPLPAMLAAVLLPRVGGSVLTATLGVLLTVIWALGYRTALPRAFGLSAGAIASLAFLQATATAFDGDARAIAFLAEALIVTILAAQLKLKVALLPAGLFGTVGLLLALGYAARPQLLIQPPPRWVSVQTAVSLGLTGLVLAAAAITLCWAVFRLGIHEHAPHGWVPAGLLALYGMAAAFLSVGLLISPDRDGFLLGHVLVTVSWTVGALVLLLRGVDSVPLRVTGLSLVVAALAKLVLFDLSSLDGMARVAAFLVAGLVLLAAGARYAKLVATR
jgi:uncharacterized membrane protein